MIASEEAEVHAEDATAENQVRSSGKNATCSPILHFDLGLGNRCTPPAFHCPRRKDVHHQVAMQRFITLGSNRKRGLALMLLLSDTPAAVLKINELKGAGFQSYVPTERTADEGVAWSPQRETVRLAI
ncbi:MAG: hypothetical protein EON93_01455 [Burkholderiales bacterium]|nr:MAG: hypothetical protein EON93_01455 [Burkholderiales bacterium]